MKTAKVLLALTISACAAAAAVACSPSPNRDAGVPSGTSSASGTGTPPPRSGSTTGSGGRTGSGVSFACGPNNACSQPLNFCCISVLEGGTGQGAATVGQDAAPPPDAGVKAGNDSGEAGALEDSGVDGRASGVTDAATPREAGNVAAEAGGGGASSQSVSGFDYHCSSSASTCPMGTSVVFACAGVQNCSSGQACCADFVDGGFIAQCGPAPCTSGVALCVSPSDCRSGEACVPASDYAGAYNICAPSDGGMSDGGQQQDSSHGGVGAVDGSPTDGGAAG